MDGEAGAGEGGSRSGGEGCNELAAMQGYRSTAWCFLHCEASILTAAEMQEEEEICFSLASGSIHFLPSCVSCKKLWI